MTAQNKRFTETDVVKQIDTANAKSIVYDNYKYNDRITL